MSTQKSEPTHKTKKIDTKKRITVRLPPELLQRLESYGIDTPTERSLLFEAMLTDYLEELDFEEDKLVRSEMRRDKVSEFWDRWKDRSKKAADIMLP